MCFFGAVKASGQYYVSTNGSDANSGTISHPFKTIQKAASIMIPGDTCYIHGGTYRETVVPVNSGTSTSHLVFRNYQNDTVRITGTDKISNWNYFRNGIFRAFAPDTVLQLSVDNSLASEAMYPNFRGNHLSTQGWKKVSVQSSGKAVFDDMNFPDGYWTGGTCFALVGAKWISGNGRIDSSKGDAVYCKQRSSPWNSATGSAYFGDGTGYITHHLNALDTLNEWHWQNDTLYYYPKDSSSVNQIHVEARTRIYGFNCSGKNFIEVNGIHFIFSTVCFESSTGCRLNNANIIYPTPYFYFDQGWGRDPLQSNDYSISHWKGKGVAMSGEGNTVRNCYIAHSWGDGVSIGGKNNTVDSCLILDCDWSATDAAPVATIGIGHTITHSRIFNSARDVLVIRSTRSATILYNDLHDCGFLNHDLGMIYSFHTNGDGTQIAYNWIHDNNASGPGVYLDNYDTGYVVHHNVIWNCFDGILTNTSAVNHQVYNNTVWSCVNAIRATGNPGTGLVNQIVKNNLSNKDWNVNTTGANNLAIADPGFVNSSAFNFTLKANSPAIDFGCVIPGMTDGFKGKFPDAGAYEFGIIPWVPGSILKPDDLSFVYQNQTTTGTVATDLGKKNSSILVYPNPVAGELTIQTNLSAKINAQLFDYTGKSLTENISFEHSTIISTQFLSKGIYFLKITDSNSEEVKMQKIVVIK
ncbi:MAG: T9SS type A sorting domain-containing protein [Bacteroidia bacterium]